MTSCVAIAQLSAGRKTFKQATSAGASHQKQKEKVNHCAAPRMDTRVRSGSEQQTGLVGLNGWRYSGSKADTNGVIYRAAAATPWWRGINLDQANPPTRLCRHSGMRRDEPGDF